MDTTDQQAVTVAQIDVDARQAFYDECRGGLEDSDLELLDRYFARHRLASVSSASADWTRTKAFDEAAAECMRAAEASAFADTVSEDERKGYRSACNLMAMNFRLMASYAAPEWLTPEPVPATNQAGEVEHGYVAYGPDGHWHWSAEFSAHESVEDQRPATLLEKRLFNAIRNTTESLSQHSVPEGMVAWGKNAPAPKDWDGGNCLNADGDLMIPLTDDRWVSGDIVAYSTALATQPATSQEDARGDFGVGQDELVAGFKRALQHPAGDHDGWTDAGMEDAFFRWPVIVNALNEALAATPTPPTLSEDLREALEALERQAVALYRAATPAGNYGANAEGSDANQNAFADKDPAVINARAALARVKAS